MNVKKLPPLQPDWLRETVAGLTTSHLFQVFLEGTKFAIVYCPGHMAYINRMRGSKYAPPHYTLMEKGKGYWSHTWKELHKGRLNKESRELLAKTLSEAELKG